MMRIGVLFADIGRNWYWGSQEFAEGLMKMVERRVVGKRSRSLGGAAAVTDHCERSAKRLLEEGLKAAGLDPKQLATVKSPDPLKASLAHLLWTKTTVSQKWIAEALKLKSAPNAGMIIRRYQATNKRPSLPAALQSFIKSYRDAYFFVLCPLL